MAWCSSRIEKSAIDILGDCTSKTKKINGTFSLSKLHFLANFSISRNYTFFANLKSTKVTMYILHLPYLYDQFAHHIFLQILWNNLFDFRAFAILRDVPNPLRICPHDLIALHIDHQNQFYNLESKK